MDMLLLDVVMNAFAVLVLGGLGWLAYQASVIGDAQRRRQFRDPAPGARVRPYKIIRSKAA